MLLLPDIMAIPATPFGCAWTTPNDMASASARPQQSPATALLSSTPLSSTGGRGGWRWGGGEGKGGDGIRVDSVMCKGCVKLLSARSPSLLSARPFSNKRREG